jgi:hypothetical protein
MFTETVAVRARKFVMAAFEHWTEILRCPNCGLARSIVKAATEQQLKLRNVSWFKSRERCEIGGDDIEWIRCYRLTGLSLLLNPLC